MMAYTFVLSSLLTVFFTFASSIKIFGWQKKILAIQLTFFANYGLNRGHMRMIGLIELSSATLLFISMVVRSPEFNFFGALGILVTSIGAIYFHLRFDTAKDAIPALITAFCSSLLIFTS